MSEGSSNAAAWFTLLEPAKAESAALSRADDPRLGAIIERWDGRLEAVQPGRAVIVGFPQDEGVRRNGGRVGAAKAPDEIRRWLHRLSSAHAQRRVDLAEFPPLDAGNVKVAGSMEDSQTALAAVLAGILKARAIPIVLGGGHETAFGHYLAYINANIPVGIINIDAHLDVRPCIDGLGHSGSSFRQALEHPSMPLAGSRYCCIGAQPIAVSQDHFKYLKKHKGNVWWLSGPFPKLAEVVKEEARRLAEDGCKVLLSIDADAFAARDVPGVSAPNPLGFAGDEGANAAFAAGAAAEVSSFELVEINPLFDLDGRSAHWAAATIWHFLIGLSQRAKAAKAVVG